MNPSENAFEENRRMRRTMRDLVALSTLPAVWIGLGTEGIARSLADALLNILSLDLVFVRLWGQTGEGVIEVVDSKHRPDTLHDETIKALLAPLLKSDRAAPAIIPDPFGAGMLHVAVTRFGVGKEHGVLITGSRNAGFPTEQDRALLGVGANQIAIVVQRRQAEEQAHEHQEWLRVTLASIGDAVIATDTQGHVTFLNGVAEQMMGWTNEDAQGQPLEKVFTIFNEETRQPVENPVKKVLCDGAISGLGNHTVLIAKDGTERPIDDTAAPIRDAAGKLIGAVLIFRDVTEQRRIEREVLQSEARKKAILETALDCIITMDHEGKVVEFNPAAEKTFGYSREQIIDQELCQFIIPPSLRNRHREGLARYLATGEGPVLGKRLELHALRADGTEFLAELAITRISTVGPPLFTAYLRDINEREQAERYRNVRLTVTHTLIEATSVEEGVNGVLRAVCEELGWDVGFFWTVNDNGNCLLCRASWRGTNMTVAEFETDSRSRTFTSREGLPGRVWASGKPAWILHVSHDTNFPRIATATKCNLHSAFACPVIVGDRTLGIIEFFTQRIREADAALFEIMETVAGNVGQFLERKTAEDDLRRNEQELADFFENSTVGLHWVGPDGIILRSNRAELEMLGYSPDEYVGRHIADFHADEDVIGEILKRLKAGDKLAEYPARLRCKDGSIKEVLIDSSVLWRDGQFVHTRCFTRDVTDRKRAEAEAREQEQRTRTILESITDAFCTFDLDWQFTYVNRQAETLLGLNRNDLLGKNFWAMYPDTLGTDVESNFRRSVAEKLPLTFETFYRPHDRWYELHAYPSPDGLSIYFRDVSQRRRDQTALLESEEKLRLLADTIPQLAWMARPDGHIFWYNRRWYEYTGTTPEQMEGWGWQSVHDPEVLPKVLERWKRSIASGEPFDMVFPLKGTDDKFRPFLTRVNALRDERGRILYWFGTNTDISEIKRMEEALRDADRRKDEFLATLAHELRNPLAPIRNSLQILKMPRVDAITAQQTKDVMERQVHHLVRLVDDLLDMSRVMRGKIQLRKEEVELATVVARAVETAQPLIELHGHRLDISLPSESLLLNADAVRLVQVVGNLLTNAAKYTEPNGCIWLTADQESGQAVLRVRDNGTGIAPDMLPHVFELFVQVDHGATRSQGGLGIGLTLVKNLVEMHGGTVEVHSAGLGKGCEFRVRLPLWMREHSDPNEKAEGEQRPERMLSGHKVLVVDDNKDAANTLAMLLKLQGHEVRVVHDGNSALEAAKEFRPAVVFLDIGMPGMDGYEVARRMRQIPDLEKTTLAALTGWGQQVDRQRTAEEGFDHHLIKPLDPEILERVLTELTHRKDVESTARRFLIVENNVRAAEMLSILIGKLGPHAIHVAHDEISAIEKAKRFRPQIILLDIGLPKLDGYTLARRIRECDGGRDVLLVALTGDEDRTKSNEASFDEHILKPVGIEMLRQLLCHPKLVP